MTNKNELSRIADLIGNDSAPRASPLVPDVRSGSSFTYSTEGGTPEMPAFLVVWFYTVDPDPEARAEFARRVKNFESVGLASIPSGVFYRGTYSVSISGAAPDFEYRTVWGLEELGKIQQLNDHLHTPPGPLQAVIELIAPRPAMRSEIMGRTKNSAVLTRPAPRR
jgi:hypothetical protein